ncbi:MAG: arginine--tRNA ligase [Eubacteriales bacterium]
MKAITQILSEIVSEAFQKCGYDKALGFVTASDRIDLCQFQCNGAFDGAKLYRKAPFAIANEIVAVLKENAVFAKAEAAHPGFINITLSDDYLLDVINQVSNDEKFGIPQAENPETIIVDYGGPNVAKPLHIGHLRSAIIGESLKRLARVSGNKVIGDVHLGDWGLQIGLVIAELEVRNPSWKCFDIRFKADADTVPELEVDMLNEVYPFASSKSKEDEEFKLKAQEATFELQHGREGYIALWKEILRVSINDLKQNYANLNVDFDLWYGESDAEQYVDGLIDTLNKKGLLRESDGAMVVDIAEEEDKAPMPPIIVKKTDNSNLYATTDLATIVQREKDFNPDKIWYVVDSRQGFHFIQVFRCARKAQLVPETTELEFLGFGTMNGSDGKPYKTRDGGVMRLSDLLDTATNEAQKKLNTSTYLSTVSAEEKTVIARKVGIAAIKFGDLINHRSKDYIFDLDKFLSFEGKTGAYILYTITRINSILKKVGTAYDTVLPMTYVYTDIERELILKLILTGDVFSRAIEEKATNYICENAYEIAANFSSFYHESHVVDEADEAKKLFWVALIALTRKMLLMHLDVLGIDAVENM